MRSRSGLRTYAQGVPHVAGAEERVVFSIVSASTSAIADLAVWIQRLMRAFGSPNLCGSMELCGWGRAYASRALVARRRARCPEDLNAASANLQVSKQAEGEGQDEEPTKALGLTIPPSLLGRADQVIQ